MTLLAGIKLYLFTSLSVWTKGKNVCKGSNKYLSETPMLNQPCKTLVRTTTKKSREQQQQNKKKSRSNHLVYRKEDTI